MMKGFLPVVHAQCGMVAFYLGATTDLDGPMHESRVRLLDGRMPSADDTVRCGGCGKDSSPNLPDLPLASLVISHMRVGPAIDEVTDVLGRRIGFTLEW